MDQREIVIVGGGPAGAACALQIARREPELARHTVIVDAARFPRDKLCGGGIVREADQLLSQLGVEPAGASVPIHEIQALTFDGPITQRGEGLFRVVRRLEFDAALLDAVRKLGIDVLEEEPVTRLSGTDAGVRVTTKSREFFARVVIGADGARSAVRRDLVGPPEGPPMVALEAYTEGYDDAAAHTAVFDFRPAEVGLRGYSWDFPSLVGEQRIMNRGIGGASWPADTSLKELFEAAMMLRKVDLRGARIQGWSAPAYSPESPQSAPHALLAGDAVGVDPWLGEGITTALSGGMLAANTALEGLWSGMLEFRDYRERLRESAVGWHLIRKLELADPFYQAAAKPGGLRAVVLQAVPS